MAVDGTQVTLTATSSTESSLESTTESSTESGAKSMEESSTESSESTEETTSESSTEASETGSSTEETSTEDITASESTHTTATTDTTADTSSSVSTPTLPPGTNPTYCEAVRGPLTPEEEVQLAVLFGDSSEGTTFADHVVSYASQLVAQIADVDNIVVGDNDYVFTTAFDSIDVPGVLGLASAAPI